MRNIEPFAHKNFDVVQSYSGSDIGLRVDCPFCQERVGSEDFKQHLHISLQREVCHCYRCDYGRSWVGLVMDVLQIPYALALGILYIVPKPDLAALPEQFANRPSKAPRTRSAEFILPEGYIPLYGKAGSDMQGIPIAKRYLRKRGFGPWYWKRYQLGMLANRILIPIEGEFWQARAIFPFQKPKYMSPTDEAKDVLFNAPALQLYDEVVINEGALSAMAVGENSVAMVGKNPTPEKINRLLKNRPQKYVVVIEGTEAKRSMMKLADRLVAGGKRVEIWSYDEADPADWGAVPTISTYDLKQKLRMLLT